MTVKVYIISNDDQLECLLRSPWLVYAYLSRSEEEKKERVAAEEFLAAENGQLNGFWRRVTSAVQTTLAIVAPSAKYTTSIGDGTTY